MPIHLEANNVRATAQGLLRGGAISGPLVTASGQVETPLPVHGPQNSMHSWFVPVTIGDQLVGYFQFLPDGTFMRYSSFQRRPDKLTGCPKANDWLDPDQIRAYAEAYRLPDETSGTPILTYDKSPDRIVWAVPLTRSQNETRFVYVISGIAYLPTS